MRTWLKWALGCMRYQVPIVMAYQRTNRQLIDALRLTSRLLFPLFPQNLQPNPHSCNPLVEHVISLLE